MKSLMGLLMQPKLYLCVFFAMFGFAMRDGVDLLRAESAKPITTNESATNQTFYDASNRAMGYLRNDTVYNKNNKIIGYVKYSGTYDASNKKIASSKLPGMLFCGEK